MAKHSTQKKIFTSNNLQHNRVQDMRRVLPVSPLSPLQLDFQLYVVQAC